MALSSIFKSLGIQSSVDVLAQPAIEKAVGRDAAYWLDRARNGAILLTDGSSTLAAAMGITALENAPMIEVRSLKDANDPDLEIIWQQPDRIPHFQVPAAAKVYLWESSSRAPAMVGMRIGTGAVLWTATPLSAKTDSGYERYPVIPQALLDLGLAPPLRTNRLWAFFDSSYRTRVDVDYFADRWRGAGIGALHIAAWHYWEPDAQRDEYLARLIAAAHRRNILVYAWLEFPHVSEAFWEAHPEWREQTAAGQDAHLDWRKLMNLLDPACEREVWSGTQALIKRFEWDGVNLAELYFESLEGVANPSRFTPMNKLVRERYRQEQGIDPLALLQNGSGISDLSAKMKVFLEWRAARARELQETWLGHAETLRAARPDLDIVLTHVDDRFDPNMRDLIGADASAALGSLAHHDFTFLIEDPATIWHLGPQRYTEIAKRYQPLTPRTQALAIDINVVERYQDVYPTKLQVGTELAQLLHASAEAFPRVTLYFENSVRPQDYPLLPIAAAEGRADAMVGGGLRVTSKYGTGVRWEGPLSVDGRPWPVTNGTTAWLPPGGHTLQAAVADTAAHITDFSAELTTVRAGPDTIELAYKSKARAFATLDRKPATIELDGEAADIAPSPVGDHHQLSLPRGQHVVTLRF